MVYSNKNNMFFNSQYTDMQYKNTVRNKKRTNIIVKNSQTADNKRVFRKEALIEINELLKYAPL